MQCPHLWFNKFWICIKKKLANLCFTNILPVLQLFSSKPNCNKFLAYISQITNEMLHKSGPFLGPSFKPVDLIKAKVSFMYTGKNNISLQVEFLRPKLSFHIYLQTHCINSINSVLQGDFVCYILLHNLDSLNTPSKSQKTIRHPCKDFRKGIKRYPSTFTSKRITV